MGADGERTAEDDPAGAAAATWKPDARREMEEALRTSERRLRAAIEGSGDGLWDWDASTDRNWMNDRWATMLGYDPSEIGPTTEAWRSLIHPDDFDDVMQALQDHLDRRTDRYAFEHRLRRKDGTYAWILDRGVVVEWGPDGQPRRVAGTHTDVTARRETEDALRATTARLQRLMDAMREGVIHYGADGAITGMNRAAAELLGVEPSEAVGTRPGAGRWRLIDWSGRLIDPEHHPSALARRTGQPVRDQLMGIRRPDGEVRWIQVSSVPAQRGEDGRVLEAVSTLTDVSPIREALETASASEARLREVLEAATDAVWVQDAGTIEWANPAMATIFGRPLPALVGQPLAAFVDVRGAEAAAAAIEAVVDADRQEARLRVARPDGTTRWIETRAHPLGGTRTEVTGRDITARKAVEEERDRLALAVDTSFDAIVLADDDTRVTYANAAIERLTGFAPGAFIGERFGFAMADDSPLSATEILELVRAGDGWAGDIRVRRRDGQLIEVGLRVTRVTHGGELAGFLVIGRDVTYERALEAKLAETARLEAIGQLAGGVAHDFNNILTAILGHAELAALDLPPGTGTGDDLRQISAAARRAQALTRQLLAFSRRSLLQPRDVLLGDVVAELEPMLRRIIGEDVVLLVEREPEPGTVHVDPAMLEHAITNLVLNARDALPGGGAVRIVTGAAEEPGLSALRVVDAGTGIEPAIIGRIFEPFFTTKGVGKGSGLGLSMVQGFVAQSGGRMAVDSIPGSGTTMSILLPATGRALPADRPGPSPAPTGRGTVLVVEDEPMLRAIADRVLARSGYTVLLARAAADALELLGSSGPAVDLLFTDVVMPGMSGIELAARARERRPDLRTLLTSGYTPDEMERLGISLGETAFLPKPYEPDALLEAIAEALP